MTKIISSVNLKGGVGKTALAVNFAAYCGMRGKKTLLIDLDPQTNATFSCIETTVWQDHAANHGTVADLLGVRNHTSAEGSEKNVEDIIIKDVFSNVDLIPSHLDLFSIDLDLGSATARETKLRRAVQPIISNYEIIVCDCPPNLTIPTQNALALSTHYVVPISPDYLSGLGVALLLNRVKKFTSELEHTIEQAGIVISRVGRKAQERDFNKNSLRASFPELVLEQEIHERVQVSVAASRQQPIYSMSDDDAIREFSLVSQQILQNIGL